MARIPQKYADCSLENFWPASANRSLQEAKSLAAIFLTKFPHETDGRGLLLTGPTGVGKTHLAVGLLTALIKTRPAQGIFYEYNDLLRTIRESYNPLAAAATEVTILQPAFDADVLVLDDLGSVKPSDWVEETVAHILNTRYNAKRTTIITTNYVMENSGAGVIPETPESDFRGRSFTQARSSSSKQTLGDRIGDRMLSRLREMCQVLKMSGDDYRRNLTSAGSAERPKEFQ